MKKALQRSLEGFLFCLDFKFKPMDILNDVSLELRKVLEHHRPLFETMAQPYIEIQLIDQPIGKPWHSKVGGFPYLPKHAEYPVEDTGQPLQLLAQLNLSEMPPLPHLPTTGILQFYIDPEDELFGANFENLERRERFRVIYFPVVDTNELNLIPPQFV